MDKGTLDLRKDCPLPGGAHGGCFTTKAETLQWLKPRLCKSRVLDMYVFSVQQWLQDAEAVLATIRQSFPKRQIVVRSSSRFEDCCGYSNAGAFHSALGVQSNCAPAVHAAVEKVIASFDGDSRDQILIQPQLKPVSIAGVVSSHAVPDGQPYYVFSYESGGGTCGVTGGKDLTTTCYLRRDALGGDENLPGVLQSVYAAMREIEVLVDHVPIQLEFGCTAPEDVVVFQVRPLPGVRLPTSQISCEVWDSIAQDLEQAMSAAPDLPAVRSLLGVMPDWNPAELLGGHPRPLAVSLYRALISSTIWCRARFQLGYRDIGSRDFLHVLAGKPYVNVRTSFSSLLPAGLPHATEQRLLGLWLDRLAENPQYHDSVEFDVAQTCVDFCFHQNYRNNYEGSLDSAAFSQYFDKLRRLTLNLIRRPVSDDLSLQKRYWDSGFSSSGKKLDPLFLREAVAFGSLPFAKIARQAFVAEAMLRSAMIRGALSEERLRLFRQSIDSISSRFLRDQKSLQNGSLTERTFMRRYGHLRPNSFDISSPCYRDRSWSSIEPTDIPTEKQERFSLSSTEKNNLVQLIRESGLVGLDVEEWLRFVREAIAGREESKFLFSRFLSDMLEQLARVGVSVGLDRESLSWLDSGDIQMLADSNQVSRSADGMRGKINARRVQRRLEKAVILPPLVRSISDLHWFELARDTPHYIGSSRVQAALLVLDSHQFRSAALKGKIVCIEFADPGFDWIFSQGISGLVTAFGGPNSHMAVRCAELELPAAIGCGETAFWRISQGRWLTLDCENKQLYLSGDTEKNPFPMLALP